MRKLLAVLLLALSATALASGLYLPKTVLSAVSAASNQTSAGQDMGEAVNASFQVTWASLTGTIDGTVKVQVSNDGTNWVDKTGATVTLSGASGSDLISLNGVATEYKHRVVYTKNNITGGTITVVALAKRG